MGPFADNPGYADHPAGMKTKIVELPGGVIELRRRTGNIFAAGFLMIWMAGWTAGTGMLVWQVYNDPQLMMILFAVPFVAAWFGGGAGLLWMLFGREQLVLDLDEVRHEHTMLVRIFARTAPLPEVQGVSLFMTPGDSESPAQWGLELETRSRSIRYGTGLDRGELRYLCQLLGAALGVPVDMPDRSEAISRWGDQAKLDQAPAWMRKLIKKTAGLPEDADLALTPEAGRDAALASDDEAEAEREEADATGRRRLRLGGEPVPRPSDSSIRIEPDVNGIRITSRGSWSLLAIAMLLFVCLFWNGIVSVFVYQVIAGGMPTPMRVGLAVFLIPFVVIGLIMFAALLGVLAGPLLVETWRFDGLTAHRIWRLGVPVYQRTWDLRSIAAIDLSARNDSKARSKLSVEVRGQGQAAPEAFALIFVDAAGTEQFRMTALTLGEAEWIADALMRQFPNQFTGRPRSSMLP